MIRVLFVDDNAIVRKGILRELEKQADLEVVGEAENGLRALNLLQNGLRVDVLLTDLNMPVMDGLELVRNIKQMQLTLPAIVLTMHATNAFKEKAISAGVRGYLLKNGDMAELFNCIRDVHKGLQVIGKDFRDNN